MILSSVRVLILGASGGVGRWLTRLAADRGHEVTALVRASSGFVAPPGVDVRVGEVLDGAALDNAVQGQEVVASCLGIRRAGLNPWAPILSPSDFVTRATQLLVPIMHRHQVRRLIALSAGGVADSFKQCTAPIKRLTKLGTVGVQYRDLTGMEAVLAGSGLKWQVVRPATLLDGKPKGNARAITRYGLLSTIRRSDVAAWILAAIEGPASGAPAHVMIGT